MPPWISPLRWLFHSHNRATRAVPLTSASNRLGGLLLHPWPATRGGDGGGSSALWVTRSLHTRADHVTSLLTRHGPHPGVAAISRSIHTERDSIGIVEAAGERDRDNIDISESVESTERKMEPAEYADDTDAGYPAKLERAVTALPRSHLYRVRRLMAPAHLEQSLPMTRLVRKRHLEKLNFHRRSLLRFRATSGPGDLHWRKNAMRVHVSRVGRKAKQSLLSTSESYINRLESRNNKRLRGSGAHVIFRSSDSIEAKLARASAAFASRTELSRRNTLGKRVRDRWFTLVKNGVRAGVLSRAWTVNFAWLHRFYEKRLAPKRQRFRSSPILDPNTFDMMPGILNDLKINPAAVSSRLKVLSNSDRCYQMLWEQAALWLLAYDPVRMMDFLKATHIAPYPSITCVEDSLQHLAAHFSRHPSDRTQNMERLAEVFTHLAERKDGLYLDVPEDWCFRLITYCDANTIRTIFHASREHRVYHTSYTWLQFCAYFTKHGQYDEALQALTLADQVTPQQKNTYIFRSASAGLLRSTIRQPSGLRVCMQLVDYLVSIGVTIDMRLSCIIMLNAVDAGDLKTAWAIHDSLVAHDSLVERNPESDAYLYGILLRGCKMQISNAELLSKTIQVVIASFTVKQHPIIATEILHCLFLHHSRHNRATLYHKVATACTELFDMAPLRALGLPIPNSSAMLASKDPQAKMQLSPPAFTIVLAAYLDHLYRTTESVTEVYQVFQRFWARVQASEQPYISLMDTTYTCNIFLHALIQTHRGLLQASEVMRLMQTRLPIAADVEYCRPTDITWSIYLKGFTKHKEMHMAEQVLQYMRKNNIAVAECHWDLLIGGYATMQNLEGTLDAVRRMEAEDHVWTDWTMKGIRRLQDQEGFKKGYAAMHDSDLDPEHSHLSLGSNERKDSVDEAFSSRSMSGLNLEDAPTPPSIQGAA